MDKRIFLTLAALLRLPLAAVAVDTRRQGSRQVRVAPAPYRRQTSTGSPRCGSSRGSAPAAPHQRGLAVADLGGIVRFYHQLLRNLNAPAP
ncbi:hypothetical protein [Ramlibacter sp.]|jgi:hypothetical protein|uniref:hypothetical protein n=1 Tax=Ramlibacter sp. TaxID=1917967 RepID=UPI00261BCB14|nr:hypothetical protein [Ramlibacter sp.]